MSALGRLGRVAAGGLFLAQVALGGRVGLRLARTAGGTSIPPLAADRREGAAPSAGGPSPRGGERAADDGNSGPASASSVTVVVPVLNEQDRLGPCLDGLTAQGPEVGEILVVDGGSRDGTAAVARAAADRDRRVRWIEAGPAPSGWNGKVHNLEAGWEQASPSAGWLLTIDADVRPEAGLAAALVAFAAGAGVPALSVATRQRLSGPAEGLLHPALLTTLVYRFGIPGSATDRVDRVQANGQCFLVRRELLAAAGGFAPLRGSLSEDVTLARALAAAGHPVGFYETEGLVSAAMYAGWRDAWRNWTRSLPMRDRYFGAAGWLGLLEIGLVQAAPLPLAFALGWREWRRRRTGPARQGESGTSRRVCRRSRSSSSPSPRGARGHRWSELAPSAALLRVNLGLLAMRLGVLVGTARAYERAPWTYWLSPACDGPAVVGVWLAALRRWHEWRGRTLFRGGPE